MEYAIWQPAQRVVIEALRTITGWPPRPVPSSKKWEIVANLGRKWHIRNFVETGTSKGHMINAQRDNFDRLVSIELDPGLHEAAARRFSSAEHISILLGNSADLLQHAAARLEGPALYWLDAHYSGETPAGRDTELPLIRELSVIAARGNGNDVILIDDARLFGWRGYPSMSRVRDTVGRSFPTHRIYVASDIIHIVPGSMSKLPG
jgi:hypothetical protein